jgi:hypothetical protein
MVAIDIIKKCISAWVALVVLTKSQPGSHPMAQIHLAPVRILPPPQPSHLPLRIPNVTE